MIDGLKLTVQGAVLKDSMAKRIRQHEEVVERYRADFVMDPKEQTEDHPCLPDHMLENMIDDTIERIAALTLIHDHIVPNETYLLDRADLQLAELLPPPSEPEWPICMAR